MFRVKGYRTRLPEILITLALVVVVTFVSLAGSLLLSACGRPAVTMPLQQNLVRPSSEPIARADSTAGAVDSTAPWLVSRQNLFQRIFKPASPAPVTVILPVGNTSLPKKIRLGKNAQLTIVQGTANTVRPTQQNVEKKGSAQAAADSSVLNVAGPGGNIQQAIGENNTLDRHDTPPAPELTFWQKLKARVLGLGAVALSAIGVVATGALVVGIFAWRKRNQLKNLV